MKIFCVFRNLNLMLLIGVLISTSNTFSQNLLLPQKKIFKSGFYFEYKMQIDSSYCLVWGNDSFRQETKEHYPYRLDTIDKEIFNSLPSLVKETKNCILLESPTDYVSAFTSIPVSFECIALPKNRSDSILHFPNYFKTIENYVISHDNTSKIYLYNLITRKKQVFQLYPPPLFTPTFAVNILSIKIVKNIIRVSYNFYNPKTGDDTKKKINRFKIRI